MKLWFVSMGVTALFSVAALVLLRVDPLSAPVAMPGHHADASPTVPWTAVRAARDTTGSIAQ